MVYLKTKWFKLDNAAKIFPPTSNKNDPKVFRFTCILKEKIDQNILQESVNESLIFFPNFRSILKKGFFWHYLETTNLNPIIKEEKKDICSSIYNKNKKKLLFRVNYYKNRINLEVYHALTDGTGALEFLKTIVYIYVSKKYNIEEFSFDYDASLNEKSSDSFNKYYKFQLNKIEKSNKVYQIKGDKLNKINVINGCMNTNDLISLAHKYNTTLTCLIVSIYILAIKENMDLKDENKFIEIDVPVNLRKYFKSQTARNFFSVIKLKYKGSNNLEDIIKYVDRNLKDELKKDNLFKTMNKYANFEHNFLIRLIPLFIKNFILKIIMRYIKSTSTVTNLGIIKVDDLIKDYIDSFEVYVSTDKMQISMCSYLDKLNISFTSIFDNMDIIKNFYRKLSSFGIDIIITTNKMGGKNENMQKM